jgi:hypothetical protein
VLLGHGRALNLGGHGRDLAIDLDIAVRWHDEADASAQNLGWIAM